MIEQHPDLFVPDFKELHYFSSIHGDGLWANKDLDWYEQVFEPGKDKTARGDISPGYLVEPEVAGRIQAHVSDAKLVCVFRDPADRVRTHYYYQQNGKVDLGYNFEDLVNNPNVDKSGRWNILNHGMYARNLRPFLDKFGKDRFHFILMDDIRDRPHETLRRFFEFVGVDPGFEPDGLGERSNAARNLRSRKLYWAKYYAARFLNRSGLDPVRRAIKATGVPDWLNRLNTKEVKNPPFAPEHRAKLIEYYRQDILELQDIIDRDLSIWLDPNKLE